MRYHGAAAEGITVTNPEQLFLGVDVGGTKVAAGLVTARGEILSKARVPMVSRESAEAGLQAIKDAIGEVFEKDPSRRAGVAGIGISSPGPLDPRKGIIINPPNLPCWRNYPLAERVQAALKLPTRVDNDAKAAGLAEAHWGAGQGYSYVFYATLGTGIGTGEIFGGQIYHGRTGAAGEGGHMTIDYHGPRCGCGKHGCIEALASGPAVARRAQAKIAENPQAGAKILSLAPGGRAAVHAEHVAQAWRAGDPLAQEILRETAFLLAVWLGNIVDLLEPDVIIFGGGMGELMSEWFEQIRDQMAAWTINSRYREIPMMRARYGEDSGIAGAAALWLSAGKS